MKCKFCASDISDGVKRCRECGSWLNSWSYIWHPESVPKVIGLIIAILTAAFTGYQANAARTEREAVSVVAENVTKMAYVLSDGSVYFDGIPKHHIQKINDYKNAMKKYLPPTIDNDIRKIIEELSKENMK